jgi:hypothetical protein
MEKGIMCNEQLCKLTTRNDRSKQNGGKRRGTWGSSKEEALVPPLGSLKALCSQTHMSDSVKSSVSL